MGIVARVEDHSLDASAELAALLADAGGDGAVVSFVGLTRATGAAGEAVKQLVLEPHPTLTLASLAEISDACAARFDVNHVRVVHRSGAVSPGQAIVFAGAAAPHRRAAFDAADYLMDVLKTEAVFWKKEAGARQSRWIEPTPDDYASRDRWR